MISHDELFPSRSLAANPWFPQRTHPNREILVRESYSISVSIMTLKPSPASKAL